MKEIVYPQDKTYFVARNADGSVLHRGFTLPNQVTSTGQQVFEYSPNQYDYLYSLRDYAERMEPLPEEGQRVYEDTVYYYGDLILLAIQDHDRMHYEPQDTPALFNVIMLPEEGRLYPPWKQPLGEHDAYPIGYRVDHDGKYWECVQGDENGNNVWEPGVHGWIEI